MLATVSTARCSAEIMEATAIPRITSLDLATIPHILQLRKHRQSQTYIAMTSMMTSKGLMKRTFTNAQALNPVNRKLCGSSVDIWKCSSNIPTHFLSLSLVELSLIKPTGVCALG